ncbi:sigma-54-dependent Fis family transcriptional regulator, partial [Candidatus Dependentiae bacterium]|nr:sigma-54-dependent Fis family transcriptional regulator [Candidatus Dependentiae bacterium]
MKILIIDDEEIICQSLKYYLSLKGYDDIAISSDPVKGEKLLLSNQYDITFLDITMPGKNGYEILLNAKKNRADSLIVILTALSDISVVINCMKAGAYDYLTKPLNNELILSLLVKAEEDSRIKKNLDLFTSNVDISVPDEFKDFMSNDIDIKKLMVYSSNLASTDCNILITGESGTGKELFAQAIHKISKRKNKPFIAININAIPHNLFESSLFGYKKGSFTDASKDSNGYIKNADSGTLFLDEIGDLDLNCQTKLLRVIEEKKIYPIGSDKPESIDFRLITATNKDLKSEIKSGKFRQDLYYRLADGLINIPPIRDRGKDIIYIAEKLLEKLNKETGADKKFSTDFLNKLFLYELPGNFRELQHIIKSSFFSNSNSELQSVSLNVKQSQKIHNEDCENDENNIKTLEEIKIDYIKKILHKFNNNK